MSKVDLDLVKTVLLRNAVDIRLVSQVLEDINTELEAEAETGEKPPAVKKQFCILIREPGDHGIPPGEELIGWVLQIPEEDSPLVTEERLHRAAYEHNLTPKGRRLPVKTIGEVCEHVSSRILKDQKVWVKTREPIYVFWTDNKIPMEDFHKLQKEVPNV